MTAMMGDRLKTTAIEPILTFEPRCWRRLAAWVQAASTEVAGMGMIRPSDTGFVMTDAYLPDQSASAHASELQPHAIARLLSELSAAPAHEEKAQALRVWWHSHGDDVPFWSGVDEQTIRAFAPVAMLSLVVDRRLKTLARLDRFDPRETIFVWVQVPMPGMTATPDELAVARQEIEQRVATSTDLESNLWKF